MNSSALLNIQQEPPFYLTILYFFVAPLVFGNIIDMGTSKLVGSKYCSFNGTDKVCTIAGQTVPSYVREIGRSVIQLLIVFFVIKYFSSYFKASVYPAAAISVFIISQPELFEDFRRFINSIFFMIKHN